MVFWCNLWGHVTLNHYWLVDRSWFDTVCRPARHFIPLVCLILDESWWYTIGSWQQLFMLRSTANYTRLIWNFTWTTFKMFIGNPWSQALNSLCKYRLFFFIWNFYHWLVQHQGFEIPNAVQWVKTKLQSNKVDFPIPLLTETLKMLTGKQKGDNDRLFDKI